MTRLFDEPAAFMDDMLEGFADAHSSKVLQVPGGVIRAQQPAPGKVSVVVGGGCGHYPAFAGLVGNGFADGAIVGNIFTSPSAADAYSVGSASSSGCGVVITAGNYAGDVMHFTEAATKLTANGIPTEVLFVTDDVASAPASEITKRRGIAGNFFVFKMLAAAAEQGMTLPEVLRVGRRANDQTRTLGVAFAGCTLPGASHPLFDVPDGQMAIGLGIHGEPGISEVATPSAAELAQTLVSGVVPELNLKAGDRVAVILNGLGATKYEELFVVWKSISKLLTNQGLKVIEPEVGELVTSLDMAGCSLTISKLDDELEKFWCAGADTPAYRKGITSLETSLGRREVVNSIAPLEADSNTFRTASPASKLAAQKVLEIFQNLATLLLAAETELGELDAIAGDGDHGRGMAKGVSASLAAAQAEVSSGAGLEQLLFAAGEQWATKAGGTSGALWGAALRKVGETLGNDFEELDGRAVFEALSQGYLAMSELGKANLGDKTMLDAYAPFLQAFDQNLLAGRNLAESWTKAAAVATKAALETASLVPKIGRARPLAAKSVGTPDPGAISLARCLEEIARVLSIVEEEK